MAKYLGVPLEISNGNKIPRNGQPNIVTNPKFLGEETVSGNYKSIDNWRIQSDPAFGFLSKFAPLNEAIGGTAYPKKTNIVASIGNIGTAYIDLQAMDDTGLNPLDVFEIGKAYEVTYTIWSSSRRKDLMMSASGESVAINTTRGTHRYSFIAQETQLKFFRNFNESNVTATISDISVKEIAATETPTYGSPELVTNGDFENDSDWVEPAAGWDILNGKANYDGTGAQFSKFYQVLDTVVGRKYELTFTLSGISANSVNFGFGSSGGNFIEPQESFSTNGTHTRIMVADRTDHSIVLQNNTATQTFSVDNVSVKEIPFIVGSNLVNKPYTQSFNLQENWSALNSSLNFIGNNSSPRYAFSKANLEFGKTYRVKFDILNKTSGTVYAGISNTGYFSGVPSSQRITTSTGNTSFDFIAVLEDVAGKDDAIKFVGQSIDTFTIANFSVTEVGYNYLQVDDANFKGLVKEGDVVFNTSTSTEGVVKEVIDNNVLLMSNDNFSTAGEFFSVFAPNNDTRGNQILKIEDLAAFDYDLPAGVKSSFWFSGAKNANKLSLYSIGESYEYHFTSKLLEEYIQRLDAQSATRSRLDIPLDKFRNGSSVTVINDIRIS